MFALCIKEGEAYVPTPLQPETPITRHSDMVAWAQKQTQTQTLVDGAYHFIQTFPGAFTVGSVTVTKAKYTL